jgi:hypothetical protein
MQAQMKPKPTSALTGKAQPKKAKVMEFRMPKPTAAPPPATAATATAQSSVTGKEADNKATVTREYNFAGETIRYVAFVKDEGGCFVNSGYSRHDSVSRLLSRFDAVWRRK